MKSDSVEFIISPPKGLVDINLGELFRYKELLYIFAWRDIKVRYKQTVLGILWAILQPFMTMVVFSVFFGKLAGVPSDGIPYPVFVYSGLLFWNYFSTSLTTASGCMIANENIIKKVYFPRILLSIASAVTPLIDFGFALVIYFILMLYFGYIPSLVGVLMIVPLLFLSFVASSGLGLFLASVNIKYRDVRYILPFFIQLLMFVTPVIYPVSIVPDNFKWLTFLNPMTGVIDTIRSLMLGVGTVNWFGLLISTTSSVLLFFTGLIYFRKTERFFADII